MNVWLIVGIWIIALAVALGVAAIINLRSADPRARGIQLVSLLVVLALMTAAFAVSGYVGATVILALAIAAEAVHLARRRRRAT